MGRGEEGGVVRSTKHVHLHLSLYHVMTPRMGTANAEIKDASAESEEELCFNRGAS